MQNHVTDQSKDTIVLVHGFGAHRLVMLPMMWRLQKLGFRVINQGYFSFGSIEKNYLKVLNCLRDQDAMHQSKAKSGWDQAKSGQIHIVAHSMGCILVRKALQDFRPRSLGRVVMMTPPSKGSPRADLFSPLLGHFVAPLRELRTDQNSLVNQLPDPDYRFGITRATHDFLIPPEFSTLSGAESEMLVQGIHSQILISRPAIDKVAGYLRTGHFQEAEAGTGND